MSGGLVYGFVGAGGNTGGAITQAIFFTPHQLAPYDSFKWLGWAFCRDSCSTDTATDISSRVCRSPPAHAIHLQSGRGACD